jgi:ribosomal protein L34
MPRPLGFLNENFKKMGSAILRKRQEKLRENLSDIGPGLLFDRTDRVLQEQKTKQGIDDIMAISKP